MWFIFHETQEVTLQMTSPVFITPKMCRYWLKMISHADNSTQETKWLKSVLISPLKFRQHYKDIQIIGQERSHFLFKQYKIDCNILQK